MVKRSRSTKQRRVILEALRGVKTHPTAHGIYEMVRPKLPRVSLGTVYRNLEHLSQNGDILKLEFAGHQRRYDGNIDHHHHVRCIRCGKLEDIFGLTNGNLEDVAERLTDFKIIGHRLEFVGTCPDCEKKIQNIQNPSQG